MHVPDAFVSPRVAVAAAALAVVGVGMAVRGARTSVPPRKVPLMGLSAAFVMAAQMLNFPVGLGASGHLIGGVMTAVLLGPAAAVVVLTCVLIVQCLMFADGGVMALGVNVFNMAIVSSVGGYGVYWAIARALPGEKGRLAAVAIGAWCATVGAAVVCAAEIAMSGVAPWRTVWPVMGGMHAIIGVAEAGITTMVVYSISRARPELVREEEGSWAGVRGAVGYGLLICIGIALFVAPMASSLPDGLEWAAERVGFAEKEAEEHAGGEGVSLVGVALGAIGVVVTFVAAWGVTRLVAAGRRDVAGATG